MFFMNNLVVPPVRFRPESQGGQGGRGDRSFLHPHSAMLSKILNLNIKLKDAILAVEKVDKEEGSEEAKGAANRELAK